MKKQNLSITIIISLVILFLTPAYPQTKADDSTVKLPWDEFRRLLELEKDDFVLSWEDFQKILQQTGFKYVPPFQLKDEKVVLTRAQFKRLLDQMKPPGENIIKPPADYLLTQAVYKGKLVMGSLQFKADYNIEIFERQRNQFIKIPLFPVNIALKKALFNNQRALIILDNNRHTLTTQKTGTHQLTLNFSLKTTNEPGPGEVSFPIPRTAITSIDIELPFTNIVVEVPNAQQLEISEKNGKTQVYGLLSPTNNITIRWRKRPAAVKKGPAKVYAETYNLLSIEDDAMRVSTAVALSILQNTIPSLILRVPEGYSILDVNGRGLEDWRELTNKNISYLEIRFEYPKKGSFTFNITAEKPLPEPSMAVDFSGFAVQNVVREKGFLGVALKSTSEVTLARSEGLDKIDVSELPASLISRSRKPLLLGFKYLHHPYIMVLDIKKHQELSVISTVVDSASGVTLFTEDGKLVHRIIFQIRNTSKQFLELELPRKAQIWSVFVGGEPAKPRVSENRILIPLNRSQQDSTGLEAFDVELIYFEKQQSFGMLGSKESFFPVPDIIISQMLWSVYLPEGYSFLHFGGSVEKEKMARGLRLLLGSKGKIVPAMQHEPGETKDRKAEYRKEADKLIKQFSANLSLSEEQLVKQMENEAGFSQRVRDVQSGKAPAGGGLLPIRIHIPTTGRLFRFAKTLVNEEPLELDFKYLSNGTMWLIRILVLISVFIALFLSRRKISKIINALPFKSTK